MKQCTKCKQIIDKSFFNKDSSKKDGLHPHCKSCRAKQAKERMRHPLYRAVANLASKKYRESSYGKHKAREYYANNKDKYRTRDREYGKLEHVKKYRANKQRAYRERNQLKEKARAAVYYAIKKGTLKRKTICDYCGKTKNNKPLEAHHHLGYEKEHWLDVLFMHKACHLMCES